jgi:hydroxymethylpyrimidine/phosphomethylpyrimidine kinase
MLRVALTIAGSDPSGGAGLQADLKTFQQHGVYGMSAVTLLTVQNTQTVSAVELLASAFVLEQLDAVIGDIPPQAAKTGALGSAAIARAVAQRAADFAFPLVVDPVMVSKHGSPLVDDVTVEVMKRELLPQAMLVTPNVHEAARLTDMTVDDVPSMERAASAIAQQGVPNVLIKGAVVQGQVIDVLWHDGHVRHLSSPRATTGHTHGSGCVLSAAITARLARGEDLVPAVIAAKEFITRAIHSAPGLGNGRGPVNMHARAKT